MSAVLTSSSIELFPFFEKGGGGNENMAGSAVLTSSIEFDVLVFTLRMGERGEGWRADLQMQVEQIYYCYDGLKSGTDVGTLFPNAGIADILLLRWT